MKASTIESINKILNADHNIAAVITDAMSEENMF